MITAFAPGRIELIGNHTDYNEGYVLAFAIAQGISIQGQKREDNIVKIRSKEFGEDSFSLTEIGKNPHAPWANYLKGVLLQLQKANAPIGGFDAEIISTLPEGMGLSSSAAIEVATALFAQKVFAFEFGDLTDPAIRMGLAALCRAAENDFVGVKCGILDQAASMMGQKDHAVFLDCRSESVELIPLPPNISFIVCHSGVKHMLLASKYNQRRSECQEAVRLLEMNKINLKALRDMTSEDIRHHAGLFSTRVFQRAMHVTTENERVLATKNALLRGDIQAVGQLMDESHQSSREAFENSTPFLDQLVEIARSLPGYIGARLTGGGFGGATLSMVYRDTAEEFIKELTRQYKEKSDKDPQAWIMEASDGAH